MKKTFPFQDAGRARPRVVDAIKHEIRKYVQRERRKDLPEGFDRWMFHCRVGSTGETATSCELDDLGQQIDQIEKAGGDVVFVEIVAEAAHRVPTGTNPPHHA